MRVIHLRELIQETKNIRLRKILKVTSGSTPEIGEK